MNDPLDYPIWEGNGLAVPPGVEVRRGQGPSGREVIVFYKPRNRTWAAVHASHFSEENLSEFLGKIGEKPVAGGCASKVSAEP